MCRSACLPARSATERLAAVLHVLYLIFNEGYASTSGPSLQRTELAAEAIRLARMVHRLLPDDSEVTGLLALMLLTDARRPARTGPDGELIPMAEQDRSRWDADLDRRGRDADHRTRCRAGRPARTSSRRRSPRSTTRRPARTRPTGRRSWRCTRCSCRSRDNPVVALNHARRGRHGSRCPRPGWTCSPGSRPTNGSPMITGCTPSAPTCWRWPVIVSRPASPTSWRPDEPSACRSSAISTPGPPGFWRALDPCGRRSGGTRDVARLWSAGLNHP